MIKSKKWLRKFALVTNLLLLIFINSCSNLGLTKTQPTPSQSNITEIPTQIISTPTKTPVVVRPPEKQDEFLDQELFDGVWNSDYIQGQKAHWERWIEYWTNAENPLIFEDLQYVLLFDKWNLPVAYYDVNLPKQVTLISTWKDPINSNVVLAFFPINGIEGGFQLDPPDVTKPYHIEPSITTRFRITTRLRIVLRDFKVYTHWRAIEQKGDRHECKEPTYKPACLAQAACQWT